MNHFHFSIGPVQSFIAQARRTRDLWAGSFLLSYLSGVAMAAVRAQDSGAKIAFPKPVDEVMKRLCPQWPSDCIPLPNNAPLLRQGGIPNRFMAEVGDGFDGAAVAAAVRSAFVALGQAVWDTDLEALARDFDRTRAIWDRQVAGFWEIAWVLDTDPAHPRPLLDARKNWRSHFPGAEPGVKCTAMDGWQELSGATGPQGKEGDLLKDFWQALHARVSEKHANDLQPGEHLCAIAWIKRRMVRVFDKFTASLDAGQGRTITIRGWPVSGNCPSVLHMAVAPWLAHVIGRFDVSEQTATTAEKLLREVADYQKAHFSKEPLTKGESATAIRCIDDAIASLSTGHDVAAAFRSCDASVFYRESLVNPNLLPGAPGATKGMRAELGALCEEVERAPSSFYALLRMDGDRIGEKIAKPEWRDKIADALNAFTSKAVDLTADHSGFLIYAGGDDVLALFPVDHVLNASEALAQAFRSAFEAAGADKLLTAGESLPTLSGAIVFTQIRVPLSSVVQTSDALLAEVAKERAGRDALAVKVVKPGGEVCEWAAKWGDGSAVERLRTLAGRETAVFSSGFLNRLRELHEQQVGHGATFDDSTTTSLLLAELKGTRRAGGGEWDAQEARRDLESLMPLLKVSGSQWGWQADAAVLVRFLAQKGNL